MKITIVSDLHLEFGDLTISNFQNAEVLVLSGDIFVANDLKNRPNEATRYKDFLKRCSDAFSHVVYVAGNHEFYHGKFPDAIDDLKKEVAQFPNVYFLEMNHVQIQDVTFLGGTLWTDMNKFDPLTLHTVQNTMNDFHIIKNSQAGYTKFRPAHSVERHNQTVQYIKKMIEGKVNEKFVVVGHHAPCTLSIHKNHKNDHLVNGAYASDLSEIILDRPQIKLWTHGHTHYSFDYMLGDTRIVCNPRGYYPYDLNPEFDANFTVEI